MNRLDEVINYRLVLIVAPSGSGKTARLRAWSRGRQDVAWVSLVEADNQPARFLGSLDRAMQPFLLPELSQSGPALYSAALSTAALSTAAHFQPLEDILIDRMNCLVEAPSPVILVLDGYQVIVSPEVHGGIALLLEYLPPQLHLVIAGRCEPPLPLPRLRVRRQLLELGAEEL